MEGHLRKRSDGSWTLVYELPRDPVTGKRRRKWETVHGTKKDAERLLRQRLSEIDDGAFIEPSKLTVAQFLEQWLKDYAATHVRPKTLEGYESIIRVHVVPAFGSVPLAKLTPTPIQALYASMLERGRSATRVERVHRCLREALHHGVKWGLLVRNVADAVSPPRPKHKEMVTLAPSDAARLMDAVRGTVLEPWIGLALYTGLRRSEVAGLKWADVDLAGGSLSVMRTLQRVTGKGLLTQPPKTARSKRKVALSAEVAALLKRHRAAQLERRLHAGPAWEDGDWLFSDEIGRPLRPDTMSHQFAKLARSLGLATARLHDLRHTHASLLLSQGVHPKIVSERLGHSTVSMTLDRYSHVLPGLQEAAAEAFDQALAAHAQAQVH
jgi:integrase